MTRRGLIIMTRHEHFYLRIDGLGNQAFEEADRHVELARLLRVASDSLIEGISEGTLRDYNGNVVGSFGFKD